MNTLDQQLQDFLKALASDTRQRILLNIFSDGAEHDVGEVAERMGIGASAASENLSMLKRAGFLTARRQGKHVFYCHNRDRILELMTRLSGVLQDCC